MAYSTKIAELFVQQLNYFQTCEYQELAVFVIRLDYWMAEALHCQSVLTSDQSYYESLRQQPSRKLKVAPTTSSNDFTAALKAVREATFLALKRVYCERLIDGRTFSVKCAAIGRVVSANVRYCSTCNNVIEDRNPGDNCLGCSPSGYKCAICKRPLSQERQSAIPELICKSCSEKRSKHQVLWRPPPPMEKAKPAPPLSAASEKLSGTATPELVRCPHCKVRMSSVSLRKHEKRCKAKRSR